ncbi:RNA-binding S4 domain-containing protein [Sedimenticola selenatireducens]|jgi:ribosome-associated heat shock protein Hsp15|uniref:Heat shock protein 15 n=1 Tax=Sedimenticola selenatireducens TaxID=191960 RepID=A0A557SDK1_9GAMM|nr:S4 domain-containing protein [Sedimenticola selenatireducens]TVO75488.1 RNA-binding S4 domain-containing protein [Sedimenticola selenatireducens]TVT65394.1 MAG: RNA-binding S4 domain-containing protein [Sedimenticola selenatireducens]
MNEPEQAQSIRLDKWLWAARFFKTRQLAIEAINGGKVHLNGQRSKPGKNIGIGSRLTIHKDSLEWEIEVSVIPKQRRPASEAIHFYREDEASQLRRQKLIEEQRLLRASAPRPAPGKPSKRDRRMIHSFTGKD